jgi:hypothetical protein
VARAAAADVALEMQPSSRTQLGGVMGTWLLRASPGGGACAGASDDDDEQQEEEGEEAAAAAAAAARTLVAG